MSHEKLKGYVVVQLILFFLISKFKKEPEAFGFIKSVFIHKDARDDIDNYKSFS